MKQEKPSLLIISFSELVSDARILKQIALFKDDFALTTCGYGPKPAGAEDHVQIPDDLVYWHRNRLALLLHLYQSAYWSSPAVKFAYEHLRSNHFDTILADDLDTVGVALALKPKYGVHADLHEYSPREKEDVPRWRLFVAPYVKWQLRTFVTKAKSSTTVGRRIAQEYRNNFGISPDVVTNATPFHDLQPTPIKSPIALVHSGAGRRDRYMEVMIDAVENAEQDFTFDLYLTPNDPEYIEQLKVQTAESTRVTIRDAVPYNDLVLTLNQYDVGIHLLPPVNFNNEYALPNKLFDFLQARLGVIISPSPEMARVVEEYGFGTTTTGFTAGDLTTTLDGLTRERVEQWKQAANRAAQPLSAENAVVGWDRAIRKMLR